MTGFRFGRFELDSRTRELLKDGVRIRLQDQPFEILAGLLERPGELLTRDELRDRLWPNGTFVDFEHGLNAAVKRLRAALGDNAGRPRFVETLPRRGYRFIATVERTNGAAGGVSIRPSPSGARERLAVLPFDSLSEATASESFSSGLTEELITELGRLCADRLGVIARASIMRVERAHRTAREIGTALRADYLAQGTVRIEGDRVRITAQLVETAGETQLWAQSYARPLADSLLAQSEVAADIVRSVAMELLPDRAPLSPRGTRHSGAYQLYVKGRYHWHRPGVQGLQACIDYYQQATALDPGFAAAHGALARAHVATADYYVEEPRAALKAAAEAAGLALALDPGESEAYAALAEVRRVLEWNWAGAEHAFQQALTCNPNNEGACRLYGLFLAALGRTREATTTVDRACDLDPLCLVANAGAAWVRYLARDYHAAAERCRHTLDMDASFPFPHRLLAAATLQLGDPVEAVRYLDSIPALRRDAPSQAWLAHALAVAGDQARATSLVRSLEALARRHFVSAYHRALAAVGLGDLDTAFALLGRASEDRDPSLIYVATEPRFDPVRSDSRYAGLLGRLGLSAEMN